MGLQTYEYITKNWVRYLDDSIIWNKKLGNIEDFISILESLHESIGFKRSSNTKNIPFLDIDVQIDQTNNIQTDVFYKVTDTHQYLDFRSCHPRHTKNNIPFNLARRICTITSQETTRLKRLLELKNILIQRNYPPQLIENGIQKALDIDRKELLKPKTNTDNDPNILTFVHTHNPNNVNMGKIVTESIHMLKKSEKFTEILNNTKLIMSKRQSPNLKKILTRAALPQTTKHSSKKCGDKHVRTSKSAKLSHSRTKKLFKLGIP